MKISRRLALSRLAIHPHHMADGVFRESDELQPCTWIANSSKAFLATLIVWIILVTPVFAQSQPATLSPVVQAVQQALQKDMDYPSKARSQFGAGQVTKVAVLPPYAMATWTWGPTGGWAILIDRNHKWQVITRRSDWIGLRGVVKFGIPQPVAIQLLDQIIPDWKTLPSE